MNCLDAYTPALLPPSEAKRLAALQQYTILDTDAEQAYDDLTSLASVICDVPIALISLVDTDRQWFKSKTGIDATETPRDISFCAHAILQPDEIFEIPNALNDARFAGNPLVQDDPKIRFYAGAPLVTPEGMAISTLCVIDREPKKLSDTQRKSLVSLARQVVAQFELRRIIGTLELQSTTTD